MKVLQLDVDRLAYDVLKPEASVYEETKEKHAEYDDALVMWVCVEKGDTDATADAAMKDTLAFMDQVGRRKLVVYPFAHLSSDLAEPKEAMRILEHMYKGVPKGIEAAKAPFGWTKKFTIEMKGHPLAEQSKSYDAKGTGKKTYKKAKPVSVNTATVKKSDWSGLPDTDHRSIGEKLDLYSFQEVSPGMVYWHPKGLKVYLELVKFIRENQDRYGYQEISTPAIANLALWQVSGHLDHYRENMFIFENEGQEYGLKPMNCPSSILIYKSRRWSYRDLPFRSSIMDRLYRNEISGALTGLFRVRELTQDDSHIFARDDQLQEELHNVLKLLNETYSTFGFTYKAKLSTMPDDHLGDEQLWERATEGLKKALEANKIAYEVKEKEGAFYGPKIDVDIQDSMGREWQCATIQIDYQLPLRFKLEYAGEDGKQHTPAIIHKTIYGSLERFLGILVEHYQGKFPTWLAPVQVKVISISDQSNEYAHKTYEQLRNAGIRVEEDIGDRTMEYKLREAIEQKIPYMLVVGKKEVDAGTVAVRVRSGGQKFGVKLDDFIEKLHVEIGKRLLSAN